MDFLVIGGDARQTALASLLATRFSVATLGVPELPDTAVEGASHLVLPIPSVWSDGMPRGICWDTLELLLQKDVTVYGGAMGALRAQLESCGAHCVDLLSDAAATVENARLTAEAALLFAMQHTKQSPHALACCVVGFGRIGRLLCARLAAFGARVCAVSATAEKRALAEADGFASAAPEELAAFSPQWIFNTAPAQLIPPAVLSALPETTRWVELASAPGGLPSGTACPVTCLHAGGLPGKLLPVSAARVLYAAILRDLGIEERAEA